MTKKNNKNKGKQWKIYVNDIIYEVIGCMADSLVTWIFVSLSYILYHNSMLFNHYFVHVWDVYFVIFFYIHVAILYGPSVQLFGNTWAHCIPYLSKQATIYNQSKYNKKYWKSIHLIKSIIFVVLQTIGLFIGMVISVKVLELMGEISNQDELFNALINNIVGDKPDYNYNDDIWEMVRYTMISLSFLYCDRCICSYFTRNKDVLLNNKYNFMKLDGSCNFVIFRCLFFHYMFVYDLVGFHSIFKNGVINNVNYKLLYSIYWNKWSNCDFITILVPFIFVYYCDIYSLQSKSIKKKKSKKLSNKSKND